jgi:carotenoid cleavage dioxygenase
MAVTETHSIFLDLNVGYDFSMLKRGYRIPVCWQEARQSRLGVVPRHGGKITWLEIEPCFIQHVVNAYDVENGVIVLDVVRYPWYFKMNLQTQGFLPDPLGILWRYRIDLSQGKVTEKQLGDRNIELPRINESHTGRYNRYLYAVEQPTTAEMRGIIRYDAKTGVTQQHAVDAGDQNSEPVFVPRGNGEKEDDGWLLASVYRKASNTNEIRILDARNLSAPALATIALGRRIPAGFHGAWIPAS